MAVPRMNTGFQENPTASDSSDSSRRIPEYESDQLTSRIKDIIGDRKTVWFAAECGIGESTLRNILAGAIPRTDILVAIANAGGVTIDWLATGRLPKTRAELRELQAGAQSAPGADQPADEAELMRTYRTASDSGKAALNKVATAIRTQSMSAWFHAGMAVSEAANVFEKKK